MSVIDKNNPERYDTPKEKFALDIENLDNFVYDMQHCIKCKGCYWVDHTYMPGMKHSVRCPSNLWKEFDSYGAFGKMRIGLKLNEGKMEWTDHLLELIYADPLCGACDVGCKRNLDLEVGLTLEALRVKAVKDGAGPLPVHKDIAAYIDGTGNCYGAKKDRNAWMDASVKPAEKADIMYFVGCSSSYENTEIPKAVAKVLQSAGVPYMLMKDESCCGNIVFSVGMVDEAREIAKKNVEVVRNSGAKVLMTSCAECYRMWKVDYPKLLNIRTDELGFTVKHFVEVADEALAEGRLKLTEPVNQRITYHDACNVSRNCDDWEPYEGERGWMGTIEPRLARRRGRQGLYAQARNLINAVPGLDFTEMPRMKENSLCCAGGRGTKQAFPELAEFAARDRLEEVKYVGAEAVVSACPWCKSNFSETAGKDGETIDILDIAQLLAKAIK
ncbi:MAG: (Fe-S)-binding protein [Firmicutes bacterium]|nr:(Fe-S)-binding protein [Bacillota bacterium]